jgi:hypothetical protein
MAALTEIAHRTVEANGIRIRLAEAGEGPLVVLCHGFPESWHSWRWQLIALAEAGYHAVAPDMRGYGETDRPEEIEKYTIFHLVERGQDVLCRPDAKPCGCFLGVAQQRFWAENQGILRDARLRVESLLSTRTSYGGAKRLISPATPRRSRASPSPSAAGTGRRGHSPPRAPRVRANS